MLRVTVIFQYDDINDPESDEADTIMEELGADCEGWRLDTGASMVWIDDCCAEENEA